MDREHIIRMAREAGLTVNPPSWGYTEHYHFAGFEQPFERFFQAAYAAGAAAERSACAKVCENKNTLLEWPTYAAAIRARGNT